MFAGTTLHAIAAAMLVSLLAMACASDLRTRKIPNKLVLVIGVLGIVYSLLSNSLSAGLVQAFGGIATGLALWFPFYALRMLGAGDVKLFAAASAWLGAKVAVEAALWTALIGGTIAIGVMMVNAGFVLTLLRLMHAIRDPGSLRDEPVSTRRHMPYAFAIAGGLLVAASAPGLLLP